MESMESSYADQEDGGIMDDNYIPNLTKLAKENINFSDKADGKARRANLFRGNGLYGWRNGCTDSSN